MHGARQLGRVVERNRALKRRMNAYLFSGLVSQYYKGQFVDSCSTVILYGKDETASWKTFEEMLLRPNSGERPGGTKIQKMVGAPVLDQLLAET